MRFNRAIVTASLGLSLVFTSIMNPAHADASWADILQPLVRDVIVPSAKIGVQKWMNKKTKNAQAPQSDSSAPPPPPPDNWNSNSSAQSITLPPPPPDAPPSPPPVETGGTIYIPHS